MPSSNFNAPTTSYDSRWFIWTIVFLVVTGISLVSYITLSDSGSTDPVPFPATAHAAGHKIVKE